MPFILILVNALSLKPLLNLLYPLDHHSIQPYIRMVLKYGGVHLRHLSLEQRRFALFLIYLMVDRRYFFSYNLMLVHKC